MAGTKGAVVEVNSETVFSLPQYLFQGLVKMIAQVALESGPTSRRSGAQGGWANHCEALADTIAKIGENMTLRRRRRALVTNGVVASYVHNSVVTVSARSAFLVGLESTGKADELNDLGANRHACRLAIRRREAAGLDGRGCNGRDILGDKHKASPPTSSRRSSSPAQDLLQEVACSSSLLSSRQESVAPSVKEAEGKAGGPIKVAGFVRFALGKGSRRPSTDSPGRLPQPAASTKARRRRGCCFAARSEPLE